MEKTIKAYKIIPVEFKSVNNGAYILSDEDGEQYEVIGNNFPTQKGGLIQMDNDTFLKLTNDIVANDDFELIVSSDENNESKVEKLIDLSQNSKVSAIWTQSSIQILINMMKKLSPHVFHPEGIRTMKQMWEIIAKELDRNGFHYEIQQVESKWKTLTRTYRMGLDVRNKNQRSKRPFDDDIKEIISNMNKSGERSSHATPCGAKKIKLGNTDREEKKTTLDIIKTETPDEKVSNASSNQNAGGINTKLSKIIEAIETGTLKRDQAEQRKMEQRERLIKAIEKGNELLYQLLNKK